MARKAFEVPQRPKVGAVVVVRGIECRVIKVYPFGTMDVEAVDGSRAYRVTGLGWL